MSTNSLLSSLYNTNKSPNSRSSSMFTKNLSILSSNNKLFINREKQKNRSSSTAKSITNHQFNTQNEIQKWTPLIKTVHKLGAKLKKQYFFFWCRMEALVKSKIKLQKKQNINNVINFEHSNTKNSQKQQKCEKVFKQIDNIQKSNINILTKQSNQSLKKQQILKQSIIQSQFILKSKNIIVQEFVSNLSVIQHRNFQNFSKIYAFKQIKRRFLKNQSIQKLSNIKFCHSKRQFKNFFMKKFKNISNLYIKIDLLNNIYNYLKNKKLNQGFTNINKINQQKLIKKIEQKKNQQLQKINFIIKDTQQASSIIKTQQVKQTKSNSMNFTTKIFKPMNFLFPRSSKIFLKIKEDEMIHFNKNQSNLQKQRMKKLSHLYHQEPIFQIPDISDITLFNSTISQHDFQNKCEKKKFNLQMKTTQTNRKKQLEQFWDSQTTQKTHFISQQNKEFLRQINQNSPIFEQCEIQFPYEKIKKMSSCTNICNIILTKRNSAQNISKPLTVKKTIDIFSKKNSVQNIYQSNKKQYQTVKITNKSLALKQLDHNQKQQSNQRNQFDEFQLVDSKKSPRMDLKKTSRQKQCITVRIPTQQLKKNKNQQQSNNKQNHMTPNSQKKPLQKKLSISNLFNKVPTSASKKYAKSVIQSQGQHKSSIVQNKSTYRSNNKQNILTQSSTKRLNYKQKIDQCSQFNADPIILKLKCTKSKSNLFEIPTNKMLINQKKQNTEDIDTHLPIFEHVQMTEQNHENQDFDNNYFTSVHSANLIKEKKDSQPKSIKLRSKLQKLQMNTARKMKIEIENMINQRKKTSLGLLKY